MSDGPCPTLLLLTSVDSALSGSLGNTGPFKNLEVQQTENASWNSLPAGEFRKYFGMPFDWIGLTTQPDSNTVCSMLEAARDIITVPTIGPGLVFSSPAIPKSLLQKIPATVHLLLRVATNDDLALFSMVSLAKLDEKLTVLELLQDTLNRQTSIEGSVDPMRLPHAGPKARSPFRPQVNAIHNAAASLGLRSMELRCVEAGLLLLNDYIDESHAISQTMEGKGNPKTADYWHGIMHRREPDAGNASYWFRRVGHHPAMDDLACGLPGWMQELKCGDELTRLAESTVVKNGTWDPFAMVQLSTSALRSPGSLADQACRIVGYLEMVNLLAWTLAS